MLPDYQIIIESDPRGFHAVVVASLTALTVWVSPSAPLAGQAIVSACSWIANHPYQPAW